MRLRMRLLEAEHKKHGRQLKTYKVQTPEELALEKANAPHTVWLNMPASLETAQLARTLATRALGHSCGYRGSFSSKWSWSCLRVAQNEVGDFVRQKCLTGRKLLLVMFCVIIMS